MDRVFRRIEESRGIDTRPTVRVESGSQMMEISIKDIVVVQAIKSTHLIDIYTTNQFEKVIAFVLAMEVEALIMNFFINSDA